MNEGELDRLRQGVDRIEIHELLNRYAHAIDFMDWPLLEQVFTEDAVADYSSAADYVEIDSSPRGRDAIVAYYETALAPFAGHRARVIRLIMAAGLHGPRSGPRYAPRDIRDQ